ncbi:MAG: DUF1467 family protein [Anaplasma sp.]
MVAGALLVFTITWWVALFIALPIGIEEDPNPTAGCASGAPNNARVPIKIIIVTMISALLTCVYCYLKFHGHLDINPEIFYSLVP